jgi:hypothetical protein
MALPGTDEDPIILEGESVHAYLVFWWLISATAQRTSDPNPCPRPSIPRVATSGKVNYLILSNGTYMSYGASYTPSTSVLHNRRA